MARASAAPHGGNGADVSLANTVSGSTTGSLTLTQNATGGNGGSSTDGGHSGAGGNASSSLTFNQNGIASLSGTAGAFGGGSGDASNNIGANGGAGGTSTATIDLTGNGGVGATANAGPDSSSHGGNILSGVNGFSGGAGGSSTASATAASTSTAAGFAAASSTANGEFGGNVPTTLLGSGGAGGDANATALATGAAVGAIATAFATGGNGGSGNGFGFIGGNSGNATANATANSAGGPANANANAQSGAPGSVSNSAVIGSVGTATATASATGFGQAQASATGSSASVFATGSSASTTVKATGSGLYSFVQGTALAPADRVGAASSQGIVNGANPAPTFATAANFESAAYATAAPLSSDVTTAWASDANVKSAFNNNASNVNGLLLANMQYAAGGTGASHDYSSVLELNENNAPLTGNGLVVGLLTPQLTGSGLQPGDLLRFRIQRQGITLVDQIFSTNPTLGYFQNSVFDLGVQNSGLNGANLDVQFLFDLTTTHPGSGVGAQFIVGNDSNAQIGVWNNAAGGSWATPTNWSASTLPDGPGVQATFGSVITAPQTVTLDETTTVGNLQFNNANSYTIAQGAGGGSLILDNAGAAAIINVSAGSHSISAPISLASDLAIVQNSSGTLRLTGPLNDSAAHAIMKSGSGTAEISGSPTLGANTAIAVNGGTIRFAMTSGSPTLGSGVSVAVNAGGTLELAGSVSALSSGSNRVNIVNSSIAPGVLISGTSQIVGNIDGSGTTQVNAGSDLTANHIVQNALVIGGAAGSPALVTIDASDASGNPLGQPSEFASAGSVTPNDPTGAGGIGSANLSSGDNVDRRALSTENLAAGGNLSAVPEPSALLLVLVAVTGLFGQRFALRRRARHNNS